MKASRVSPICISPTSHAMQIAGFHLVDLLHETPSLHGLPWERDSPRLQSTGFPARLPAES
jgi:hypothetical protein